MCYSGCPHENYHGECTGRVHGIYPCDTEGMEAWEDEEICRGEERDELEWLRSQEQPA